MYLMFAYRSCSNIHENQIIYIFPVMVSALSHSTIGILTFMILLKTTELKSSKCSKEKGSIINVWQNSKHTFEIIVFEETPVTAEGHEQEVQQYFVIIILTNVHN